MEGSKSLDGKVCVVTGANTGIGRVTATELAKRGGRVILACRSKERTQPVVDEIQQQTGNTDVHFMPLDLAELASVQRCADTILAEQSRLDLLINNAGVAGTPGLTKDGFELTFGVNHLGHFLLTTRLLDLMKRSAPARIVNVASRAHYRAKGIDYAAVRQPTKSISGMPEYEVSKLANVLFTKELARRLEGTGVTTYSLHPGVVASDIWRPVPWPFRSIIKWFMISNEEGAKTTLHCALSDEAGNETGLYYDKCRPKEANKVARDEALAQELWERSEAWIAEANLEAEKA